MLENHKVIRLVDLLETEDGELFFNSLANSFLSINKDVEKFIKEKALQSVKLSTSSTYLVISKERPLDLTGYFSLATKMLTLKRNVLSQTKERIINRFGYFDVDSDSYKVPAILIAQLGRNFSSESSSISGSELIAITLRQVKNILSYTSGKAVFLECEKKEKLINFYKQNGFSILDNEVLSMNQKELTQLYRLL